MKYHRLHISRQFSPTAWAHVASMVDAFNTALRDVRSSSRTAAYSLPLLEILTASNTEIAKAAMRMEVAQV